MKNINKAIEEKEITTKELISVLSKSFIAHDKANITRKHPSVFIQGQPGVGKSQAVYQIADNIEAATNKNVNVVDVRLLLFNPVDLRGIPVADVKNKTAIWLTPEIFKIKASSDTINILFLDELTAAPSSLQAAAYQIALDRKLGEHTIPDNTYIIAAGNRKDDNAISFDMPSALKNRFIHFMVKVNLEEWMEWAKKTNINYNIINFLENNPDRFSQDSFDSDSNIVVTPRSWEMLSNLLNVIDGSLKDNEPIISSVIGNSLSYFLINEIKGVNVVDIVNGRVENNNVDLNDIQRITSVLEDTIETYIEDENKISNVLNYMNQLPPDYLLRFIKLIIKIDIKGYDISRNEAYKASLKLIEVMYEQTDRK